MGLAVAVLSALLIREPAREFPAADKSSAAAVTEGDAVAEGGAAGEASEERESFKEALGIVFQSNTVKLVSFLCRSLCAWALCPAGLLGCCGIEGLLCASHVVCRLRFCATHGVKLQWHRSSIHTGALIAQLPHRPLPLPSWDPPPMHAETKRNA